MQWLGKVETDALRSSRIDLRVALVVLAVAAGTAAPSAVQRSGFREQFALEERPSPTCSSGWPPGGDVAVAGREVPRADRGHRRRGPALHSVIEINPDALAIADQLDAERKAGRVRGPLHGIPILIKDNIATADRMMTTAGSLALAGAPAPRDAFIVARLREAGAVILGKTNLSEWANFRSTHSSSGWSGRGGQTSNPYALDRNPSGSSSGIGRRRRREPCRGGVGTETDGSIVSPSNVNGARRHQADARPGQPHRHRADRAQPGHGRADGAHRRRRRGAARRRSAARDPTDAGRRRPAARRPDATTRRRSTPTACAARASASSATGCSDTSPAADALAEAAIAT